MQNILQLVLKQPEGKLPFIGILFSNDYLGARENQRMVNEYSKSLYKLEFKPIKNEVKKIDIVISQYVYDLKGEYKDVAIDAEKLKRFLAVNYNAKYFSFGHIAIKQNKHYPLRTSIKSSVWALKLEEVKINVL